jgi:iron complex outermembrane receptor protein
MAPPLVVLTPLLGALFAWPIPQQTAAEDPVPVRCGLVWEAQVGELGGLEALSMVRLELRLPGRATPLVVRTRDDGHAKVDGLCAGEMTVTATKLDHLPVRLTLNLVEPTTRSNIELEPLHDRHSEHVITVDVHSDQPTNVSASESIAGGNLARIRGQGLADTLAGMSGVATLRGTAGGLGKPIIRGHLGRRNLIVVDGIRHESQDWGLDHAPEVDPYSADRITVIKGAGTTRFGAKAIGGVVLLESRPLPQHPGVRGELGTVGFSNPLGGGGSARIDYAPAGGRGFAMRFEGNLSRHQALMSPDYALDNTGVSTWNAGTLLGYSSEEVDFSIGYHIMRMRGGICICLRISTPEEFTHSIERGTPVDANAYRADFKIERPKQEIWHHLASARARIKLGRAGEIHALYSFQWNDRQEFDVVRKSVVGPQFSFGLATHASELRFEHTRIQLREWTLVGTLGVTYSHQTNQFKAATTLIPDYRQSSWAVYDIERIMHERIELELGVRYEGLHRVSELVKRDYLGQQASGRLSSAICKARPPGGVCEHLFNTASATLGLLARPIQQVPDLSWRWQLNSSARIPSIDEHFMNGSAPSFPILGIGSSKLGIERSWGGESTLQYDGDWLLIEATGHAAYINNYIYFVPQRLEGQCAPLSCTTRGPLPVFAFMPTNAFFGGGELRFDLRAPRLPFGLAGSASWVRAVDLRTNGPLAFIPADRYWLAGRYYWPDTRVASHGYLELNMTAALRQRRYQPELDFSAPPPAYVLLGAGIGVEFPVDEQLFRLSLIGTNLLNTRYRNYTSLLRYFADEAGWGLQLRFSAEFDVTPSAVSSKI